jgi:hypothetical protein
MNKIFFMTKIVIASADRSFEHLAAPQGFCPRFDLPKIKIRGW